MFKNIDQNRNFSNRGFTYVFHSNGSIAKSIETLTEYLILDYDIEDRTTFCNITYKEH